MTKERISHSSDLLRLPTKEALNLFLKTLQVRHARTVLNEAGILQGSTDPELSAGGKIEAAQLGEFIRLQHSGVGLIVVSPMIRAKQTATIIQGTLGGSIPVFTVPQLSEYSFGEFEGQHISVLKANEHHESWLENPYQYQMMTGHPEKAEPLLDFLQRVSEAIDIITTYQQELRSRKVLVVSHATIIRAFRFIASLETKIETQEQLQAATAGFFYDQNGNFIKIPHGMVNIRMML